MSAEKNQFLERKLYNDKRHITIEDMMAYIDAYCPDKREWFKGLLLETKTETSDDGTEKKAQKYTHLQLKSMFYEECLPKREKPRKKTRREKMLEEMGW